MITRELSPTSTVVSETRSGSLRHRTDAHSWDVVKLVLENLLPQTAHGAMPSFHLPAALDFKRRPRLLGRNVKRKPLAAFSKQKPDVAARAESTWQQQLFAAEENERCRIARELHDVLGQYVTALRFGLDNLAHKLTAEADEACEIMKLQSLVEQFDQEFHHVALKLRPPVPETGLQAALVQYALEWSERSGVRVDLHNPITGRLRLSHETETALYRILQEALNNIQKYAHAQRVSIILELRAGQLQLVIEDDGCGFDLDEFRRAASACRKIGLASMQERAELIGGVCEIETSVGQGTTIFVRVPLAPEEVYA